MSIKYALLPLNIIEELILKLQGYEMAMEETFGHCRTIQQLIEDGEMPHVYFELIGAKENAWGLESSEQNYKEGTSKMKFSRPSGIRIAELNKTIE